MAVVRDRHSTFSRKKRILIALNVTLMIAIASALFLGICYLSSLPTFRRRIDLTQESTYSLSSLTLDRLRNLDKEVEIIALSQDPFESGYFDYTGLEAVRKQIMDYAGKLLEEYVIHSGGRIRIEVLDRFRDNLRVSELRDRIGIRNEPVVNVMVVSCGENSRDIYPDEMATLDKGGTNPRTNVYDRAKVISYNVEAAITSTIMSVVEEKKPKVYVTTGREEASIQNRAKDGIYGLSETLGRENIEVEELKLYDALAVPEDCDVLIIPGPRSESSMEEIAAVRHYLRGGGRMFLALSPDSHPSMEVLLEDFNVGLDRSITCKDQIVAPDQKRNKSFIRTENFNPEARITRSLADSDLFAGFQMAGAVIRQAGDLNVHDLVGSDKDSWGDVHAKEEKEGNFLFEEGAGEYKGPRTIGVACEGKDVVEGARLVFFADTFFYTNQGMSYGGTANYTLVLNSMNWLLARERLLDIPSKNPYASYVSLKEEEFDRIGRYILLIIPGCGLLLGLVVWFMRRR